MFSMEGFEDGSLFHIISEISVPITVVITDTRNHKKKKEKRNFRKLKLK